MHTKHKIDAEITALGEILAIDKNLYQIPNYQRPYSWDSTHLSELIDDLVTAHTDNKEEEYFCGSLVLVENQKDGRFDVVDGQQRITTFVIMACVFRDVYCSKLSQKAKDYVKESIKKRHGHDDNGDDDKHRYCLQYLNHQIYWHSILVTATFEKYPHIAELKSVLVAYFYQNWIAGSYVTRIKQTSLNVLNLVKSHKSIEESKNEIQSNLNHYRITEKFKEELESKDVYHSKWCRALLLLIEYFSTDNSRVRFISLQKNLHVEHILPQTPSEEWRKAFNPEQIEKWTHSLANPTLLSGKKDSEASNRPFSQKREVYLRGGGVATSFVITQAVGKCENWDVSELEKRQKYLLEKVKGKLNIF